MRGLSLGILMVIAVATVLGLSLRSLSREKDRLLQGFASTQQATARELVSDLEDRLRGIEEDARVIATLVKSAPAEGPLDDGGGEARTMLASFRALATVVRHYRSLALFGPDGTLQVSAVDPSEKPETVEALLAMSRRAAQLPLASPHLTGPVETLGRRTFYRYRFPVGARTVVITIDVPRFLQSALRSVPDSRIVVTDPGSASWTGCAAGGPCDRRPTSAGADGLRAAGVAWLSDAEAQAYGLPRQAAVSAWQTTSSPATGNWTIQLVASAGALHAREQSLARQLMLTAIGLLAAMGLVGIFLIRQQRHSAALTERLRNAEALQSLERQLIRAEKLATTGALAAGIAHEVGTPLGIIRARAEILMDELGEHQGKRPLVAIINQIDRISSTIRQVLDFSRAQAVEMRPTALGATLRSTLDLLDHRFGQQGMAVHVDLPPDLPSLAADANQLQQVLINLLLNACDACASEGQASRAGGGNGPGHPRSGGEIWISARVGKTPGQVRLEIRDTGEGIAAENLLAVFDPFFTTKKRGEGTGLGLSVAASIVRNHGGEITLSSVRGEGTTVTMFWPVAMETEKEKDHAEA